jgi:DNA-binding Xre family transcriptional regulator
MQCGNSAAGREIMLQSSRRHPPARALIAMNIDKIMRNSRKLRTQMELARASGLSQSHVSRILSGEYRGLKLAAIESIAKATGHDVWEFFID